MNDQQLQDQVKDAYELCKLQAAVDGAFDEKLLWFWFRSAWDLCEQMIGLTPIQEIEERIIIDDRGGFALSHRPTSDIRIYSNYKLVAVIPPSMKMSPCDPGLCCFCDLIAKYTIGNMPPCELPPRFVQAVARLFAYMVENRGDSETVGLAKTGVLAKSGALEFLMPDVAFVL
jgi:hypothetical protein